MNNEIKSKIEKLEKEIQELKESCQDSGRKFKTGDWVCFNHGEYPEYFSTQPWQITHWSYVYDKKGIPLGRIHQDPGQGHDEKFLRYAHPDEIEYYKSGLPLIKLLDKGGVKKVALHENNTHFSIGDVIDTRNLSSLKPKQLLQFILELTRVGRQDLSKIYEKLNNLP